MQQEVSAMVFAGEGWYRAQLSVERHTVVVERLRPAPWGGGYIVSEGWWEDGKIECPGAMAYAVQAELEAALSARLHGWRQCVAVDDSEAEQWAHDKCRYIVQADRDSRAIGEWYVVSRGVRRDYVRQGAPLGEALAFALELQELDEIARGVDDELEGGGDDA